MTVGRSIANLTIPYHELLFKIVLQMSNQKNDPWSIWHFEKALRKSWSNFHSEFFWYPETFDSGSKNSIRRSDSYQFIQDWLLYNINYCRKDSFNFLHLLSIQNANNAWGCTCWCCNCQHMINLMQKKWINSWKILVKYCQLSTTFFRL